jgi:acyl-CoA thioester hydrolase
MNPIYCHHFTAPDSVVDRNGHVNNVAYVQWMQDAAVRHAAAAGCTELTGQLGATWVVRSHRIEYLSPAFAGDAVNVLTCVANFRKVRSLRRYQIVRATDGVILAKGETDWVFIDVASGRPRVIPKEIIDAFGVMTGELP